MSEKYCYNTKCYGSKSVIPCYSFKELQSMCKSKGMVYSGIKKKDMCEQLGIPYYTMRTLIFGNGLLGKHSYPPYKLGGYGRDSGNYSFVHKKNEERLLGGLLFEMILENLSTIDDDGDEKSIFTAQFYDNIPLYDPNSQMNITYYHSLKYIIEKVTEFHGSFTDEIHNSITAAYVPFVHTLITEIEKAIDHPKMFYSKVAQALINRFPLLYEKYKFLQNIIEYNEKSGEKNVYVCRMYDANEPCPVIVSKNRSLHEVLSHDAQSGGVWMVDLPYIITKSGECQYIVSNTCSVEYILQESMDCTTAIRTIKKKSLTGWRGNVYINGFSIPFPSHYNENTVDCADTWFLYDGIPEVGVDDINRSIIKTIEFFSFLGHTQSGVEFKFERTSKTVLGSCSPYLQSLGIPQSTTTYSPTLGVFVPQIFKVSERKETLSYRDIKPSDILFSISPNPFVSKFIKLPSKSLEDNRKEESMKLQIRLAYEIYQYTTGLYNSVLLTLNVKTLVSPKNPNEMWTVIQSPDTYHIKDILKKYAFWYQDIGGWVLRRNTVVSTVLDSITKESLPKYKIRYNITL